MSDDLLTRIEGAIDTDPAVVPAEPGSVEEVVQMLQAAAPEPSADFQRALDRRVELGFGIPASAKGRPGVRWARLWRLVRNGGARRAVLASAAAAVVVVLAVSAGSEHLVGVKESGSVGGQPEEREYEALSGSLVDPATVEGERQRDEEAARVAGTTTIDMSGSTGTVAVAASAPPDARHYVLGTGLFLSVEPDDVPRTIANAADIVVDLGGYVGDSSFDVNGDSANGEAALWVPSDKLQQAMADLSDLGHVDRTTQESTDVTASRTDLQLQIRADRRRLEELEAAAEEKSDNSDYREQIAAHRSQLKLRRQALADLNQDIAMSLVSLRVAGKHTPEQLERWSMGWAVDRAEQVLERSAAVGVVGLAMVAVPALFIAFVAALLAWARRMRRTRTLDGH